MKFFDKSGETFIPTGGTLKNIEKIDVKNARNFNLTCMCDVDNPLCGETGASYVFAPQKGADYMMVKDLGGSSTNDGGAGIAAALGVKFFDKSGETFIPTGGTLKNIEKIDVKNARNFNLTCMCDVDNPLCGETGASYVFAPQKGADYMMVKDLDDGLKHYASVIKRDVGVDVENLKGGGAAGGIAAGMVAFFNAKLTSGIDVMLDGTGFDSLLKDAAFVVTGEGKLDNQTLDGKAISGLTRHAKKFGVPVIAICGQIAMGFDLEKSGLALATATSPENTPLLPSRNYKRELYDAAVNLFKNLLEKKS